MNGTDVELWGLGVLLGLALGLLVWAWLTGGPAGDPRPVRIPRHARWVGEGGTTRLHPPVPLADLPGLERDGGMVQRLPDTDDLPWQAHDDRTWKGHKPRSSSD
jgi:hypothetical protein